jgi:L-ascorbate 6-phosphate lactonase
VQPVDLAGLSIRAVPAMHGVTMDDAYGFGRELSSGLIRFLGYVVDAGGVRLYHAGDTIHYDGKETTLRDLSVDVAMLPINGRDPVRDARGIIDNLSEREAAWLTGAIGAEVVVPMHYEPFARNRGFPEWLVESALRDRRGVHVFVPERDMPFVWTSARPR